MLRVEARLDLLGQFHFLLGVEQSRAADPVQIDADEVGGGGLGIEVLLANMASSALTNFSAQASISVKLVEDLFSKLKRNLEVFRPPFMAVMATVWSKSEISKVAVLN